VLQRNKAAVTVFERFVVVKSITVTVRRLVPNEKLDGTLSRDLGRFGNMDITSASYDFVTGWTDFTFTLGDSGPFTFLSRLRVLRDDRKPLSSRLPILAQLPVLREVELGRI
jgi:hypothetical protein